MIIFIFFSDSPIRQHNRDSPKRYNERRSTSNRFNHVNGTRSKVKISTLNLTWLIIFQQPAAYDDEEDDEIVSKQPPDYFNTNDDPLENSEEYGRIKKNKGFSAVIMGAKLCIQGEEGNL